ncbi:TrmH family RNA methyltransferase [Clostridium fallax]|uniref:RNA methyltransferase, TrmH family n=1 Tax=Clostridium fallax TaxID=1533 RepID=A0A1M4WPI5_9CLOT|nr:RNA methyltransferase [Clostridium fallax]SHE83108.1 RNA methyltransferase, TrmH family [Clostridium fallax]SQB06258.1 TrmH family RNA methyltransferase [Clostridium fallax]
MKRIESKDNNYFKEIKKLKERKHRKKEKKYIVEGIRFVEEAIKSSSNIESIVISSSAEEKVLEYFNEDLKKQNCYILNDVLFNQLADTESPQGILAIVKMKEFNSNLNGKFFVLADRVQDPGNMGTIIRTSHAAGVDGIIITKGTVDVYNDKTLRSTMGSIFYIDIIEDNDLTLIEKLKKEDFKLVVSSLQGQKNFFEENLKGKIIIAVGNEGNGISNEVESLADILVKIPMPGNAESLNVSVASSIMIYEKVRQNIINSVE